MLVDAVYAAVSILLAAALGESSEGADMATEQQSTMDEAREPSGVTVASRPWLKSYQQGVPASVRYEAQTLPELFDAAVKRFANNTAAAYFGANLSYRDLDRLAQFAEPIAALRLPAR